MKIRTYYIQLLVSFLYVCSAYGQSPVRDWTTKDPFVNFQSPNFSTFMNYGRTPVNLARGTISLDIPIYHYKDNDFDIPISITYASNGFKVGKQTGILGEGWILNAGGCISREVVGTPDDEDGGFLKLQEFDMTKMMLTDVAFWNGTGKCAYQKTNVIYLGSPSQVESIPDKYHFSFMGYQGSFMYDMYENITSYDTNSNCETFKFAGSLYRDDWFTIITEDGYRYVFGKGIDCKEFVGPFFDVKTKTMVTWMLSEIIAPNGRKATFKYSNTDNADVQSVHVVGENSTIFSSYAPTQTQLNCEYVITVLRTCYLTSIIIDDGIEIKFQYSPKPSEYTSTGMRLKPLNRLCQLEVFELSNNIKLRDCQFTNTYANGAMFLDKLSIAGEGNYRMFYYTNNVTFPKVDDLSMDHWGYFNGRANNVFSFLPESHQDSYGNEIITGKGREPNFEYSRAGMLKEIHYPTDGYTSFEYEGNTYSRLVEKKNSAANESTLTFETLSELDTDRPTGGVRIKKITDYSGGKMFNQREFVYGESSKSSGLLLYMPRYRVEYEGGIMENPCPNCAMHVKRASPSNICSNVSPVGTHIIYGDVTENNSDGSSVKYKFYTYNNAGEILDVARYSSGGSYFDNRSVEIYSYRNYFNYLLRDVPTNYQKLGMLVSKEYYDPLPKKVKEESYSYGVEKASTNVLTHYKYAGDCFYRYDVVPFHVKLLKKNTITLNNTESHRYGYNSQGQMSVDSFQTDANSFLLKKFVYPNKNDVWFMAEKNLLNKPESKSVTYLTGGKERLLERVNYVYSLQGDIPVLSGLSKSNEERYNIETVNYLHDGKGNITQILTNGDRKICYIWGYGGKHCVAKIVNGNISDIKKLPSMKSLTFPLPGALTQTQQDELYGLANCEIEIYEYKSCVGISKSIDNRGYCTYYEYDDNGRLIRVKDHAGHVLREGEYHIVTDK